MRASAKKASIFQTCKVQEMETLVAGQAEPDLDSADLETSSSSDNFKDCEEFYPQARYSRRLSDSLADSLVNESSLSRTQLPAMSLSTGSSSDDSAW